MTALTGVRQGTRVAVNRHILLIGRDYRYCNQRVQHKPMSGNHDGEKKGSQALRTPFRHSDKKTNI